MLVRVPLNTSVEGIAALILVFLSDSYLVSISFSWVKLSCFHVAGRPQTWFDCDFRNVRLSFMKIWWRHLWSSRVLVVFCKRKGPLDTLVEQKCFPCIGHGIEELAVTRGLFAMGGCHLRPLLKYIHIMHLLLDLPLPNLFYLLLATLPAYDLWAFLLVDAKQIRSSQFCWNNYCLNFFLWNFLLV